jgi:hypothetical protein
MFVDCTNFGACDQGLHSLTAVKCSSLPEEIFSIILWLCDKTSRDTTATIHGVRKMLYTRCVLQGQVHRWNQQVLQLDVMNELYLTPQRHAKIAKTAKELQYLHPSLFLLFPRRIMPFQKSIVRSMRRSNPSRPSHFNRLKFQT